MAESGASASFAAAIAAAARQDSSCHYILGRIPSFAHTRHAPCFAFISQTMKNARRFRAESPASNSASTREWKPFSLYYSRRLSMPNLWRSRKNPRQMFVTCGIKMATIHQSAWHFLYFIIHNVNLAVSQAPTQNHILTNLALTLEHVNDNDIRSTLITSLVFRPFAANCCHYVVIECSNRDCFPWIKKKKEERKNLRPFKGLNKTDNTFI